MRGVEYILLSRGETELASFGKCLVCLFTTPVLSGFFGGGGVQCVKMSRACRKLCVEINSICSQSCFVLCGLVSTAQGK